MLAPEVEAGKARTQLVREMSVDAAEDLWVARFGTDPVNLTTRRYEDDALWFGIGRKLIMYNRMQRRVDGAWHTYYLRKAPHEIASGT